MIAGIEEQLAEYDRLLTAKLDEIAPRGDSLLAEAMRYHLSLGGKRLRPALCLATCAAMGGEVVRAADFAAAVELLHSMFLVHDDLEDRDRVRRDKPAVWVKYGEANAINIGDGFLGLAYRAVLRTQAPPATRLALAEAFTFAYERTVEGQSLDINRRADPRLTLEAYEELATLKTGYYLVLGMVGGALAAGAGNDVVERIWEFGRYAGPAFQARDDTLDLTSGKGRGGRIGCDIEEGKPSILYAWALSQASPAERARLISIMAASRAETGAEDVRWTIALYERLGAIEFARKHAAERLERAREIIAALPLRDRSTLERMVDYLIDRDR